MKGKQQGVLGLYTRGKETVRIKRAADIEVAAHEIAHLLDDRIPNSCDLEHRPDEGDLQQGIEGRQLRPSQCEEGFAEFVRLYMTQPEQALSKAPEFSKWFGALPIATSTARQSRGTGRHDRVVWAGCR